MGNIEIHIHGPVGDKREIGKAIARAIEAGRAPRLSWWRRALRSLRLLGGR